MSIYKTYYSGNQFLGKCPEVLSWQMPDDPSQSYIKIRYSYVYLRTIIPDCRLVIVLRKHSSSHKHQRPENKTQPHSPTHDTLRRRKNGNSAGIRDPYTLRARPHAIHFLNCSRIIICEGLGQLLACASSSLRHISHQVHWAG